MVDTGNPHLGQPCRPAPRALLLEHVERVSTSADRRQHQAQDLITSTTAPSKQPMREGMIGIPGQFVRAEPLNAGSCRRWQPALNPKLSGSQTRLASIEGCQH